MKVTFHKIYFFKGDDDFIPNNKEPLNHMESLRA